MGGLDSLLVESICWLDDVAPSFNQSAGTSPAVMIVHCDLTEGFNRILYSGSLTREYFGFQDLIVVNRGEDRSFHVMEDSIPIWATGLVR